MTQVYLVAFLYMLGVSQVYPIVKHFAVDKLIAYVIFAPVWGAVSDKLGKRKPLIATGFLFSSFFYAFAQLCRFDSSTLCAKIFRRHFYEDVTEKSEYGKGMGIVGAGIMFGILIGGRLGKIDTLYPFYSASAVLFLSGLISFFRFISAICIN